MHALFLDFKKLENIENAGTRVNNYKFAKDSSIRATLFKGRSSIMGEEIIGNMLFAFILVRILLKQLDYSLSISMRR